MTASLPPEGPGAGTPAPQGKSFFARLIGVFVAPAATFDDVRERPGWWAPLIVIVVAYFVISLLIPESLIRETMESQMGARGEVTPEQIEAGMKFARIWRYVGAIVGPVLSVLVTGAILFLIFALLAGAEARFVHFFSLAAYASLIQTLGAVVTTPIAVAQGDLQTRLSFALLLPGLDDGFAYALLNGITIFGLWTAVVMGIGASRISRTVSTGAAVGIVLGLYALWVVAAAALAAVTGSA
jgi:hypothetical protein